MMWFIIGGLLVAVVVVAYFVLGNGMPAPNSSSPAGGDVSVNVDTGVAPAAETAPDAAPAEPSTDAAPAEE